MATINTITNDQMLAAAKQFLAGNKAYAGVTPATLMSLAKNDPTLSRQIQQIAVSTSGTTKATTSTTAPPKVVTAPVKPVSTPLTPQQQAAQKAATEAKAAAMNKLTSDLAAAKDVAQVNSIIAAAKKTSGLDSVVLDSFAKQATINVNAAIAKAKQTPTAAQQAVIDANAKTALTKDLNVKLASVTTPEQLADLKAQAKNAGVTLNSVTMSTAEKKAADYQQAQSQQAAQIQAAQKAYADFSTNLNNAKSATEIDNIVKQAKAAGVTLDATAAKQQLTNSVLADLPNVKTQAQLDAVLAKARGAGMSLSGTQIGKAQNAIAANKQAAATYETQISNAKSQTDIDTALAAAKAKGVEVDQSYVNRAQQNIVNTQKATETAAQQAAAAKAQAETIAKTNAFTSELTKSLNAGTLTNSQIDDVLARAKAAGIPYPESNVTGYRAKADQFAASKVQQELNAKYTDLNNELTRSMNAGTLTNSQIDDVVNRAKAAGVTFSDTSVQSLRQRATQQEQVVAQQKAYQEQQTAKIAAGKEAEKNFVLPDVNKIPMSQSHVNNLGHTGGMEYVGIPDDPITGKKGGWYGYNQETKSWELVRPSTGGTYADLQKNPSDLPSNLKDLSDVRNTVANSLSVTDFVNRDPLAQQAYDKLSAGGKTVDRNQLIKDTYALRAQLNEQERIEVMKQLRGPSEDNFLTDLFGGVAAVLGAAAVGALAAGALGSLATSMGSAFGEATGLATDLAAAGANAGEITSSLQAAGYTGEVASTLANAATQVATGAVDAAAVAASSGITPEMLAIANATADPIAALNAAAGWTAADTAYLAAIGAPASLIAQAEATNVALGLPASGGNAATGPVAPTGAETAAGPVAPTQPPPGTIDISNMTQEQLNQALAQNNPYLQAGQGTQVAGPAVPGALGGTAEGAAAEAAAASGGTSLNPIANALQGVGVTNPIAVGALTGAASTGAINLATGKPITLQDLALGALGGGVAGGVSGMLPGAGGSVLGAAGNAALTNLAGTTAVNLVTGRPITIQNLATTALMGGAVGGAIQAVSNAAGGVTYQFDDGSSITLDRTGAPTAVTDSTGANVPVAMQPSNMAPVEDRVGTPVAPVAENTIPVKLADGTVGQFDPATGTVTDAAGIVVSGTDVLPSAPTDVAGPYRLDLGGMNAATDLQSSATQSEYLKAPIPAGTRIANPNVEGAYLDSASNAWVVREAPVQITQPINPVEIPPGSSELPPAIEVGAPIAPTIPEVPTAPPEFTGGVTVPIVAPPTAQPTPVVNPDGSTTTTYPDGSSRTVYADGSALVKDTGGQVVNTTPVPTTPPAGPTVPATPTPVTPPTPVEPAPIPPPAPTTPVPTTLPSGPGPATPTPVAPTEPTAPAPAPAPEEQPVVPITTPIQPTVPTAPGTPTTPGPVSPTEPTGPTTPGTGGTGGDTPGTTPTTPGTPTTPTTPTQPVTPTVPTVPTVPTQPTVPTVPTVPTQPTVPTEPVAPTEPTTPTEPVTPTPPGETVPPVYVPPVDTTTPKWKGWGEITPLDWGAAPDLTVTGLNPGWITNVPPQYQTTNMQQSKFYWGQKPFQPGPTFNRELYTQAPAAPAKPWGLQQMYTPLNINQWVAEQQALNARRVAPAPVPGPVKPS